jgi:thiol-disulfide isomerase/thioredoxin
MTPTLLLWLKIIIIAFIAWTCWSIIRVIRKQKKIAPTSGVEWKKLVAELLYLGLGIFIFFWVQKNFQQQIDRVMSEKNKPMQGLGFINMKTGLPDSLGAYKGKVVILNLWATWCGPCRKELPALEKIQAAHKKNLVVLALSDEPVPTIHNFNQQNPVQLLFGSFANHPMLDSLSTRPVSILIDTDGLVKDVVVGARGLNFFRDWIEPYLQVSK